MKNNSNIYDIDGQLLRRMDDTEQLSMEEAEKRLSQYQEKLKENPDKAGIYNTYIQNLQRYILNYYIAHPEEAQALMAKRATTEAQIKEAVEQLKADVENETVMDEYVEYQEEKDDEQSV